MSIHPAIRYTDPNKAVDWLCAAFGFTATDVFHDEQGVVQHAVLTLGDGSHEYSARDLEGNLWSFGTYQP